MSEKILFIGVGWEQMPLILQAKKEGYIIVATSQWKKHIDEAIRTYWVDSRNIEELENIYLKEQPDAVLADECDYSMYAVAYLTEKYNKPGPSLNTQTITNNKFLQRKLVANTKIKQPMYYECWNYRQVLQAAQNLSYPVVVKSVDNRGSIGVYIAKNEIELRNGWYGAVKNSHSRQCIIEEYIEGEIITADGFCNNQEFYYISSATKESYAGMDNVAKILYYPGKLSEKQFQNIESACKEIVNSFEIDFGFIHFEFMLKRETNELYFIEGANRGGGVFISNIVLEAITGVNWSHFLLSQAMGKKEHIKYDKYGEKRQVIMYFIEPKGKLLPEEIVKNYKVLAMHMNASISDTESKGDARGRQGVVILAKSSEGEELLQTASQIETDVGTVVQEYNYYGGQYV